MIDQEWVKLAEQNEQKTALVCRSERLTYGQLLRRAGAVRAKLAMEGAGQGDVVAIVLERGIDVACAIVGVMLSGAAVLIADTAYPEKRIRFMCADAGARITIDSPWMSALAEAGGSPHESSPAPGAPALIVYTSGSTGNPKGVRISRATLEMARRGMILGRNARDVFMSCASFSFIAVVIDLIVPLTLGATVHIMPDDTRRDARLLAEYVQAGGVTTAFLPPQMAAQFLKIADGALRIMPTGTEKVRNLYSDKTVIWNLYGASETCGPVIAYRIDRLYPNSTPIGQPSEGSGYLLLGDGGRPVEPGETGEICVWGQIADGYINLPDLTRERFFDMPGLGRVYRTSDLGRVNEAGQLEYVQRIDWMVKVRGYRVEPGEIESVMMSRAGAEHAVVKSFENALGQTMLFGVYTAKEPLDPALVKRELAGLLPDYMIPAFLTQIPQMPLNANGKIDRKGIAPPDVASFRAAYEPPRTERERQLCEAFENALGVDQVGLDDDFTLLGGDSITAARAQILLGNELSAHDILSNPTVRQLSAIKATSIPKAARRESYPLTPPEEQMAVEQSMHPESTSYNVNLAFRVTGALDTARLQGALDALVARHAALRSLYPMEDGGFVHKVLESGVVPIEPDSCALYDLPGRVERLSAPFALDQWPLFRCRLFDTGDGGWALHFCFHHIIIDGKSGELLADELWRLYAGETLPELALEYPDYAVWRHDHNDNAEGERFFRDVFSDGVPETDMPTRFPRPDELPEATSQVIRDFSLATLDEGAKRMGVSPYALIMSALGATLGKYCDGEDVVLGAAMSGRDRAEQDAMFGMFVNSVPVRVKPARDLTVQAYALNTARAIQQANAHQTYPFEKLVNALSPERDPSRAPIFDVMVNYLSELPIPQTEGLKVERINLKGQALRTDLAMECTREGGRLRAALSYSTLLYHDEVAENFIEQFGSVLENMLADGAQTLREAARLPERQRRQILADFVGERVPDPPTTVLNSFIRRARELPGHVAIVYRDRTLTYGELDRRTTAIAELLATEHGVRPGDTVGVMIRRSELIPLCALGVMKTGAVYVPLDPSYPTERLLFMIADSGVQTLIADEGLDDRYEGFTGDVCRAKELRALDASQTGWTPVMPKPEDLMVLLYTSGTTGNPKGVMLHHRGIASFCEHYARLLELDPGGAVAAYASFGFDAHMSDLYPALIKGARVHIVEEDMRLDLPRLMRHFDESGITAMMLTTQIGRQCVEAMKNKTLPCRSLRTLMLGGEALVPIVPPPGLRLFNGYGPSECSMSSNFFQVDKLYGRVPIGRPIVPNTAMYILDQSGDLAPVGVGGELCIAGVQVGLGYLNRPDLTAEKFIANPFDEDEFRARVYKTGDVARLLPDGNVDFIGRRDFQVKIRGFRVELTEIEARIREYPGMRDATVQAVDDASGGKRVVAYVVSDEPVDIKALDAFIEEALPHYMVPSAIMQIERIPINQNGKVNRRALPEITLQSEDIIPASTPGEQRLIDVFSEALGVQIGVNTDLMYAGLSSLAAIRTAAKITALTGKALTTRQIMREKTVERLAALLGEGRQADETHSVERRAYPLTSNQMGVFYACQKDSSGIRYNIPFGLELNPDTDPERLSECVQRVLDAHAYVKARIEMRGNQPSLVRGDDLPADITIQHTSQSAYAQVKDAFVRPFVLLGGALYRAEIHVTPQNVCLLCDFHHIVFDGASLDIFLRDLSAAWKNQPLAKESEAVYENAIAEQALEHSDAYGKARAFYEGLLGDCEGATRIPSGNPSGISAVVNATVNRAAIEPSLKRMGVTQANLFLAASALVISRVAGTEQARIAFIINGREGAEVQDSFGMLVKTFPLAVDTRQDMTVNEYCQHAQGRAFDAMDSQAFPYAKAAAEFQYDAQILFAYQGGVIEDRALGGQPLRVVPLMPDALKFPIGIRVYEEGAAYRVEVAYDEGAFDFMPAFAQSIAFMAQTLAQTPSAKLGQLAILSPEQRLRLNRFNRPITENQPQALHHMFELQARRAPDQIALIARDARLTFAQLNQRANALAHGLIDRGVARGDRVAFMLPRTSDVLVAMLGVMKAGGCYIPVDPEYPSDRITHVLDDSQARCLLTTAEGVSRHANALNIRDLLVSGGTNNPSLPASPADSCYIIYTSGSTGKPKGVEISHGNIINYVLDAPENRHVRALIQNRCVMCSVTTVSFDMFLKEAFTTLMNGLTLVLADEAQANNPDKLARLINETGATAFNATPSRMLEYIELPSLRDALSHMKVIMAGGEKYPGALYAALRKISYATLINTYGPTEITVSSNGKLLDGGDITIGAPLHNVVEQVMDGTGNPLPAGVVGELYIGGAGVAKGYCGNPKLTAERFVTLDGTRYYKSGDLAKWTDDGEIIVLGRNDGQIKLRGLRIELGEIENALSGIPGVKSCVVLVRTLRTQEHLCAYYTADRQLPPEEIKAELQKTLTKYMVPTAYLQLERMPMSPTGKADLKALPEAKLLDSADYEAPANEREADFCRIMRDILKLDRVSATGNFFDMGGHSLLVTRLAIDAANRGYAISYADVFAHPTPRALAALIAPGAQRPAGTQDDFGQYEYADIHAMLKRNTIEQYRRGEPRPIGNLCLTGATGFLGAHILKEYLLQETGVVYCVLRGKRAQRRLINALFYYFSESFESLLGSRLIVLNGDVTDPDTIQQLDALPIDTYINCAANVKHFSAGTDIWDVNVKGVENAVAFCEKKGCRLIQISTVSVAGLNVDGALADDLMMDETMLYFKQDLSNQYISSKFMAERLVLDACTRGMDGKIIRVGNLMARQSDGEFQINFNTNSFLGKIKAYGIIGRMSYAQASQTMEFAPIDCTAEAVLLLSRAPAECRVFHAYNDHELYMSDVVEQLGKLGIQIDYCEDEAYQSAMNEALADPRKADQLRALIAYKNIARGQTALPVKTRNAYTTQVLLRQGFHWPITSQMYLHQFFTMMRDLGVFDRAR